MNKLWEAIDVINERGWIQGNVESDDGVCLVGAIRRAHGLDPNSDWTAPAEVDLDSVNAIVVEQYGTGRGGCARFNDHHRTTKDAVVTVLEKAAIQRDELVS